VNLSVLISLTSSRYSHVIVIKPKATYRYFGIPRSFSTSYTRQGRPKEVRVSRISYMNLRNVNPATHPRWNSTDRHQTASDVTSLNIVFTENYTT